MMISNGGNKKKFSFFQVISHKKIGFTSPFTEESVTKKNSDFKAFSSFITYLRNKFFNESFLLFLISFAIDLSL